MKELAATSIVYLEDLYRRYEQDPTSLDYSWRCAFDLARSLAEGDRASARSSPSLNALIIEIIRQRGHIGAHLDPLGRSSDAARDFELNLEAWSGNGRSPNFIRQRYTSAITIETAHIDSPEMRRWACEAFEAEHSPFSADELLQSHELLVRAEEFESFLGRKYPTKKRFGIEGAEGLFPLTMRLFRAATLDGVEEIVVGPMHRGRTSLMGVILGVPLPELFAKFKGAHPFPADLTRPADVPYHLGAESVLDLGGRKLRVTLCPNPSHLEAVDPVVLGRVRARQDIRNDNHKAGVLGLLFHTDAAVVGQGIVAETLQLSGLPGFTTGGTVHVVVNNQVGFTTETWEARTSKHCTGPFKAIDALIVHVNGDDTEACLRAADLAIGYQRRFKSDVVIDLVCYRRNGHNELDEPRFTQPVIYEKVDQHPPARVRFERQLEEMGLLTSESAAAVAERYRGELHRSFDITGTWRPNISSFPGGRWAAYAQQPDQVAEPDTGIPLERLERLLNALATPPTGARLHPKVGRLIEQRSEGSKKGIVWSVGEALAFSSLIGDGVGVRLTGQDAVRGTFSSRHFGVVDTKTGQRISTVAGSTERHPNLAIHNSPLSEYGVLGFEYGYSLERPDMMVIWEAQFGDFANGAQIVVDQFIASGEDKWLQPSGLVVLVPHGLEGQGPEHSSARPERYLQLAARDNIQITNPSTPANYFHLLRRQMMRKRRKPLIVFAPKTLLRLPAAVSPLSEFASGKKFEPVLSSRGGETTASIIFCTGKIGYELERERAQLAAATVDVVRLEMLYPFPEEQLVEIVTQATSAQLIWTQEEPENMGAWAWIRPRLEKLARAAGHDGRIHYCGRPEAASPAGSFHGDHEQDQRSIVAAAFNVCLRMR